MTHINTSLNTRNAGDDYYDYQIHSDLASSTVLDSSKLQAS